MVHTALTVTSESTPGRTQKTPEAPEKSRAQINCEAKGGSWNNETKVCTLPQTPEPSKFQRPKGQDEGFFLPGGEVSEEEFERVKSVAGFRGGSGGQVVTEEDRAKAKRLDTTPEQRAIEIERERLIAEETPQRRELDPSEGFGEKFPIFGGSFALGRTLIGEPLKEALGIPLNQDLVLTPETMRTAALTRIEEEEIERGLTANEKFGAAIEGIPLIGTLANKFAGGLIETPSENAREVKTNLLKEKRRISNIETNVKLGYLPVSVAREQLTDIENNVQRLESRLRLLISNSPELRFNSDLVNTYETEILLTREKVFQAKQNILVGATQDPTEIQILQQLNNPLNEDD